jgi:carboxyl-terminal processing protease
VVVPADTVTTPERRFLEAIAPASQKAYRALYDLAVDVRPLTRPDFQVTPALRDSFYARIQRAGVPVSRASYDSASGFVNRLLEQQIATVAFGDSASFRRGVEHDAQLSRAMDLLKGARSQTELIATAGEG